MMAVQQYSMLEDRGRIEGKNPESAVRLQTYRILRPADTTMVAKTTSYATTGHIYPSGVLHPEFFVLRYYIPPR